MAKALILSGRVQGVFCRKYCSNYAKNFGFKGSASNLSSGKVRVILESDDEQKINKYIQALKQNPYGFQFYGRIDDVSISDHTGSIRGDYLF
ncbi:MAG: acylphosphatase [Spirochaetes bacterium]|nr:acylphosphatase [Spirochaetota bacterium]